MIHEHLKVADLIFCESAPRRRVIFITSILVNASDSIRDSVVGDQILHLWFFKRVIYEVHDSIANHDSFNVNILVLLILVVLHDQSSDIWDVLSSIGLSCDLNV